ncbi:MAG: S41 family peptidase [Thiobacillus sp.]
MKINTVLRTFVAAAGLAGVLLAAPVPASVPNQFSPAGSQSESARDEVVARIRASYVDPVDEDKLTQDDLGELVRAVDPEGEYLDQDAFSELKSPRANVAGIGLEFGAHGEGLKIVAPLDDSPAARAGLKAGDLVLAIDEAPVKGLTLLGAAQRLRGEAGTPVEITILREGESRPRDVAMRREFIRQQSVRVSELEPGYFHIRISRLISDTLATLATQLKAIYANGEPKGLVLDLRDNPGGLLHCAAGIAAAFLPSDVLVASVRGRSPDNTFNIYAAPSFYVRSGPDPFKALPASVKRVPLVVLVDEVTAAGSEIVAGAFQDYKRAIVVGTRTFGRASLQTIFPLANGAALKLTTARWMTPNNRSVQNSGIVPDEVVLEAPEETTQEKPIQKSPLEHALSILKKARN